MRILCPQKSDIGFTCYTWTDVFIDINYITSFVTKKGGKTHRERERERERERGGGIFFP